MQPLRSANLADIVPEWDAKFVSIEQEMLFELILAANYLDIKSLLDLGALIRNFREHLNVVPSKARDRDGSHSISLIAAACAQVASMIKGKTPEDIRRTFNIKNDFTPEEEVRVKAVAWPPQLAYTPACKLVAAAGGLPSR